MAADISKLFTDKQQGFLTQITPDEDKIQLLFEIRKLIRTRLRQGFKVLGKALVEENGQVNFYSTKEISFIESDVRKLSSIQKRELAKITPKFAPQGSFVYKTVNAPCHPKQQMDLDDGIYLPIDMFEDKPIISKNLFFKFVDGIVQQIADEKGWKFSDTKNTCSRLIIEPDLHIDVPLYAVPKSRFVSMSESLEGRAILKSVLDSALQYNALSPDDVNLALRNVESWTISDPALLNNYFSEMFTFYKQLTSSDVCRNICRYLKAWRDYQFPEGGPSSVALMTSVIKSFESIAQLENLTEGEALLQCARQLPQHLRNGIMNPAEPSKTEQLYPKSEMSIDEKSLINSKAEELALCVEQAVKAKDSSAAITNLRSAFGARIPNASYLVILAGTAAAIRSQPALAQPEPSVKAQSAG